MTQVCLPGGLFVKVNEGDIISLLHLSLSASITITPRKSSKDTYDRNMPLQEQGAEALQVHNTARAAKGAGPLQWDTRLAKDAKNYARVLSVKRTLVHADCEEGENLYQQSCGDCTYADAVKAWLGEEIYYRGQKIPEGDFEAYGHYSECYCGSCRWRLTSFSSMHVV